MKKIVGYMSITLFVLSAMLWFLWFYESGTIFSSRADFLIAVILAVVGMITAFFARNNALAVISFMGNLTIFFIAVIFPFFLSLIWKPIP